MKNGQNHAPKVYELIERQTENPAIKADIMRPYLMINEARIALRSNGRDLTLNTEDFSTSTLLAAHMDLGKVLHRRLADVLARAPSDDADSGGLRPTGLGGR